MFFPLHGTGIKVTLLFFKFTAVPRTSFMGNQSTSRVLLPMLFGGGPRCTQSTRCLRCDRAPAIFCTSDSSKRRAVPVEITTTPCGPEPSKKSSKFFKTKNSQRNERLFTLNVKAGSWKREIICQVYFIRIRSICRQAAYADFKKLVLLLTICIYYLLFWYSRPSGLD